jgi:hypothetical protein
MASSRLTRAARLLRSAAERLRSPPPDRAFSGAAGTGESQGREGVLAAAAVAVVGSGLGLWLMPPALAYAGEAAGGQISVSTAAAGGSTAGSTAGYVVDREKKGRFLFGGERRLLPSLFRSFDRVTRLCCCRLRRSCWEVWFSLRVKLGSDIGGLAGYALCGLSHLLCGSRLVERRRLNRCCLAIGTVLFLAVLY